MRILSLYIDAFGGVSKRPYSFSEGFTEILDENGAGKSTLAAFIKAMLYGLDGVGITRDLRANEFALYRPFGGGRFGGTLTFETEAGVYRIERYFEDKRGADKHAGEFRVVDTASELPTDAFGAEPGRVLFGVDGESFLRTAYLSSRGIMAAKTNDISAKLGGLEDEKWDMSRTEDALRLIDKRRTEIRTKTKQKHGSKLLDIAERELDATRAQIAEATAAMEAEAREKTIITAAEASLNTSKARLTELMRKKEEADRRLGEEKAKREQLSELSDLLERDKTEIATLSHHFPTAAPSPETLSALEANLAEYNHLSALTEEKEQVPTDSLPTDAEIARLRILIKARNDARAALNALPAEEACEAPAPTEANDTPNLVLGVILLLLFFPAGIFLLLRRAKRKAALIEAARLTAERRLAAERERDLAKEALTKAEHEAATALADNGLPCDAETDAVDELQRRAIAARLAAEEHKKNTDRMALLRTRIEDILSAYRDLPATDVLGVRVDALRGLCRSLNEKQSIMNEHSTRLAAISAQKPLSLTEAADPQVTEGEIATLKESIAADTARIAAARERASGFRTLADGLDELYDLAEAQAAEVKRLSDRLSILDKTAALLTEAKDALDAKCLGGIRKRITAYTDRLLGNRLGEVRLNAELGLSFSDGGEGHSVDFLSTGLRAIGDICLRLALTDELYPNDPPPLILDDPFMALDEKNLSEALSLLADLAKTRQILYLTCHASRSGKGE